MLQLPMRSHKNQQIYITRWLEQTSGKAAKHLNFDGHLVQGSRMLQSFIQPGN